MHRGRLLCFLRSAVQNTSQLVSLFLSPTTWESFAPRTISVSRKFSLKFHAFFRTVLLKGAVLGQVDHFYWKKEYQARRAPHYHVLLWIRDAPVIGRDDPECVLAWLQERITCHIPDKKTDPDLHRLVTRYQMHKCSVYCKRRRKCGSTFITRCKVGFPRQAYKTATLNCVEDALKLRRKIYQLPRTDLEVRVNDYNPLLLMLWRANVDVQYVAKSSLALAHYVSGYVTKAVKSNLQDIWHEVSENKSVYSQLNGLCSNIESSNASRVTPGSIRTELYYG